MAEDAPTTTINFPGPPAREERRTTPGMETTIEGPKTEYGALSPEQQANLDQSDQLATYQQDTIERARIQQAQSDKIEAEHQQQRVDMMGAIDAERAARDEALQRDIATWHNRLEQAYNAAKTQPSPALFADGSTGERAMRAVGLALAGIGDVVAAGAAARYGTPRTDNVGQIIEADLQRQREKIAKQKDEILMARTGVKDAEDARRIALAEIDAKGAGFMSRLEAIAKARQASLAASDEGTINAQKAIAGIQEKKLEYQQRSLAPLTEKHTAQSTNVKTQGTTVENTVRETSPAAKPVNDIVMGDPLNPAEAGKPIGEVSSGRGGAQAFSQADTGNRNAIDALKALRADIEANGERPTSAAAVKNRNSLRHNAVLQVAAVSTAGQNEMAMEHEAGTIGAVHNPIMQWVAGDNPDAIDRKIHELENRQTRLRGQGLLPLSPEAAASLQARQPAPAPKPTPLVPPAAAETPKGGVPAAPAPAAQSPRARYLDILKRNPGLRKTSQGKQVMGAYNITEADLGR